MIGYFGHVKQTMQFKERHLSGECKLSVKWGTEKEQRVHIMQIGEVRKKDKIRRDVKGFLGMYIWI